MTDIGAGQVGAEVGGAIRAVPGALSSFFGRMPAAAQSVLPQSVQDVGSAAAHIVQGLPTFVSGVGAGLQGRRYTASPAVPNATPTLPPSPPSTTDIARGSIMPSAAGASAPTAPLPGPAAPNQIRGGFLPPAPLPPHPADYAAWYASKLAENMQAGAEAGPQGGQGIHFIGPDSPRMEGPAPAAVNVIRGGVQSGGAGAGSGMNLMQFEAAKPLIQARMQAQQLNPAEVIPNELIALAKARRDNALKVAKTPEDQERASSKYEQDLYRAINQSLALIQMLGGQQH